MSGHLVRRWVVSPAAALALLVGAVGARRPADGQPIPREYYFDPDCAAAGQDGSAEHPWTSAGDPAMWAALNAALADGPVTLYFSAQEAGRDEPETYGQRVHCRRVDPGPHRLTLDGMSRWNTDDVRPAWQNYHGRHRFRILKDSGSEALGWVSDPRYTDFPGKQNNITVRGFECTGVGARVQFAGDHVVFEHLDIQVVTRIGPAIGVSRTHSPQLQRFMEPCHDLTIRDTRIENVFGEAIYLSGFYPAELQDPAARSRLRNEHSQFLIERVTIRNPGLGGGQGDGIDCKLGLTELTIRDCDIAGVSGMAGIILPTTWLDVDQQLLIERCRFGPSAAGTESRRAIYGGVGDLLTLCARHGEELPGRRTRQGIGIYRSGKPRRCATSRW